MREAYWMEPKPIGAGAFGVVHRIKHLETGKMYAVKCVKKRDGVSGHPGTIENIHTEVSMLLHLRHSLNIVQLHEVFEDTTQVYLVMELCEGGNIWTHRDIASGRFSEVQAVEIIRSILRSIAQCHAKNIAYRDVKPENFLFVTDKPDSPIRAIDFGLSVPCPPGTVLSDLCGSAFYVAPEVIKMDGELPAGQYGLPVDIWGVGVVAYRVLSGELPFTDPYNYPPKRKDIFHAISHTQVEMGNRSWEGVSDAAKDFVKALLERDPSRRPTANEALSHRWIINEASSVPLGSSVVQRLQRYGNYSKFKQEALRLVAQEIVQDDFHLLALKSILEDYDKLNLGTVSINTLQIAMQEAGYTVTLDEIDRLVESMEHVCTKPSRSIDCLIYIDEFVAALADLRQVQSSDRWEDIAYAAFQQLDERGEGKLLLRDLVSQFCDESFEEEACVLDLATEVSAADIICEGGLDECEIDYEDFKKIISRTDLSSDLELYESRSFHTRPSSQLRLPNDFY